MKLPLSLFAGYSENKKKVLTSQYQSSKTLLLAFRKIAEDKIEKSYRDEESFDDATALEYAKRAAYRKAWRELLGYLPDEDDNDR